MTYRQHCIPTARKSRFLLALQAILAIALGAAVVYGMLLFFNIAHR